jgi:hypothetical protein
VQESAGRGWGIPCVYFFPDLTVFRIIPASTVSFKYLDVIISYIICVSLKHKPE